MDAEPVSALFEQLRGERLSAVTFVSDYLQLSFDGPGINVHNPLTVASADGTITSWQPGFRDLLCGQIAKVVDTVEVRPNEALVFRFTDGSSLTLSLRAEDSVTVEAYYASGFADGGWTVA